jgi:acetyl esterase/lipase
LRLLLLLAGATATALFLPLAAGVAGSSRGCTVGASDGRGASQVWILRPAGPPKSVVVYAHGWTATSPRDCHLAQMDHLCAEGSIVIFPQYQAGSFSDTFEKSVEPFRQGLQAAFARLGRSRLPVVAVGYSFGGTLVFYYAATAHAWGLPVPYAVYSIFPTGPTPGVPLGTLPRSPRYVVLASEDDTVVGTRGPRALWRRLAGQSSSRKQYRLIRSTPGFLAYHEAPKDMTAVATRIFWAPIDALVADARRGG